MAPTIHTLPAVSAGDGASLRDQIEAALLGDGSTTVPGSRPEDRKWGYKRSVPTVVLYDEQGLRLYDKITSDASEYYLFEDELNLLKNHGKDIARAMGFPGHEQRREQEDEEKTRQDSEEPPTKDWKPARWGDTAVGKWNNGVNGEEGLGGGVNRGYDVVELGAGALRKTGHLLAALAASVTDTTSDKAPITYHPLDLSYPELDRVLGEMDDAFGSHLANKVECVGLHGDYEAGLQLIREGKLASLRQRLLPTEAAGNHIHSDALAIKGDTPPFDSDHADDPSPPLSATSDLLVTPNIEPSPLPSAITDTCSDVSGCGNEGTWSPIEGVPNTYGASPTNENHMSQHYDAPPSKHSTYPSSETPSRPLHMVFLGSSLGNFDRQSAAPFLRSLPLRSGDTLLLGLDGRPAPGPEGCRKVELAYNDPAGITKAFEEHGWDIVREELGVSGDAGVDFVGRYNEELGRHEAYFKSKDAQTLHLPNKGVDISLEKDELLNIEWSYKYSLKESLQLFKEADLRVIDSWKAPNSEYRLWLLERPIVRFIAPVSETAMSPKEVPPQDSNPLAQAKGVPKWEEWVALWKLWDHITLDMIPEKMLHQKPIDLRHICLFYLGHIPTFLDIHLTRLTNGSHSHPEFFKDIFERGIDPDVDDPTRIHSHSEVPTCEADWPALGEILAFRDRVRERLRGMNDAIAAGDMALTRKAGRIFFMTFEHEAQHAETLLYMLAQSPLTRPPTSNAAPQWEVLARRWDQEATPNVVLPIPAGKIELGHRDLEAEDAAHLTGDSWTDHEFGWDNEHPRVAVDVKAFKIDSLPVSNAEYLTFLERSGANLTDAEAVPASWQIVNGQCMVRTFYGPVAFAVAGRWPLMASKNELDAFAKSKGGRMPTEAELRKLRESAEGPRPDGILANIGFKNWHPIPPANTATDNAGQVLHGHNGGVWEWTSSDFKGHEGYVPSEIYPGYSADFFDSKHFVVLGGSFATVPSLVERKSFRNWYQANYRFSFIGGRVAYDA